MFQLRGRNKQSIVEDLRQIRSAAAEAAGHEAEVVEKKQSTALQVDPNFWRYDQPLDPSLVVIAPPPYE